MQFQAVGKHSELVHCGVELPNTLLATLDQAEVYTFRLKYNDEYMTVNCSDFYDSRQMGSDIIYIPEWIMNMLGIDFGEVVELEQIRLEKADYIRIKPQCAELLDGIADIEDFFTFYLQNFQVIEIGIRYPIRDYYIIIESLKKDGEELDCAIIMNADLTTDFDEPVERPPTPPPRAPSPSPPRQRPLTFSVPKPAPITTPEEPKKFEAFSGTGYRLGSD